MKNKYENIPVFFGTKRKFEQLQLDLKIKGIFRTQDKLVNMLIDCYKEYEKIKRKENKK